MTLLGLMSESVVISRKSSTTEDSTGDPVYTWSDVVTSAAYVEQQTTDEEIVGRDQVVVEVLFVLPSGTDVETYDRIVWAGKTYEVVGQPERPIKPGTGEHHVEATARWVEG